MDDMQFVVDDSMKGAHLVKIVVETFEKYGLSVNLGSEKSAGFVPPSDAYWTDAAGVQCYQNLSYTIQGHNKEFIVLGADISDDTTDYYHRYANKVNAFFDIIDRIDIHPALVFTILRLCGDMKLKHMVSCMPFTPNMSELLSLFNGRLLKLLDSAQLLNGRLADVAPFLINDAAGLGIPNYLQLAPKLYAEAATIAQGHHQPQHAEGLVTTDPNLSVPLRCGLAAGWLFYSGSLFDLSPSDFIVALCLRLRVLPKALSKPIRCNCGHSSITDGEFIDHCLYCDQAATFGAVHRHNEVVRTLAIVARSYGISATLEPGFYTYENGRANRPDITFFVRPPLAIDVTIVSPTFEVDVAAAKAAADKQAKHGKAVAAEGHRFSPFAMEIHGHQHSSCSDVFRVLSYELDPAVRLAFVREIRNASAAALARGRVKTVVSAMTVQQVSLSALNVLRRS
jgi:hypothetical protein